MFERLLFWTLLYAFIAGIMTLLYRALPFRRPADTKPRFVFFPKYTVPFESSPEAIRSALLGLAFESREDAPNVFNRGKWYGDFSTKVMKLRIVLNPSQKTFDLYAPYFGILFEVGNLWQVADDILTKARELDQE